MTGTDATLHRALALAESGWPVFPCQNGQKIPATRHGFLDATTDPEQVTRWFTRHPGRNLAVATGAPGPDVLDVDQQGAAGNGFAAFNRLTRAGLLDGASAYVATPSGGLHAYFTGTDQRNGHLPAHHLDFRAELLGISTELVHDLLRTGQLGSVKAGRRRLIGKHHLEEFLAGGQ